MDTTEVSIASAVQKAVGLVRALSDVACSANPILCKLVLPSLDAAVHLQKDLIEFDGLIASKYGEEDVVVSDPIIARRDWDSVSVTQVDLSHILAASELADSLCDDLDMLAQNGRPLVHELMSRYSDVSADIRADMIKMERAVRLELKLDSHAKLQPKSYRC